ncbi:cold shock domain-containing protein [Streptomyces olivaceus]|uniref:cold shock domain-containing protein n=1 Tax=Streptomyces olivaceus TaxID=47716 RepID=UPI0033E11498
MVVGRVVRFDGVRGYGFIAPDHGGEDVFLHVNDLMVPESVIRPGVVVEFEVEEGDRGPKASTVGLAKGAVATPSPAAPRRVADGEEPECDILTAGEYGAELTEVLLQAVPGLTGAQILEVRKEMLRLGRTHGWIDD